MIHRFFMIAFATLLLHGTLAADTYDDVDYDWQADRKRMEVSEKDLTYPAIILKDYTKTEYIYEEEGESPVIYKTYHLIIRVNNTEAINDFNKIQIGLNSVIELVKVKARTINPQGKVTELDKDDMLDVKDDDDNDNYKIFALEGLEVGSEIEYFYILKKPFSQSDREYFQSSIPWKDVHYEIISPSNLIFKWKVYNGLPEATDTTIDEKNYTTLNLSDLPALEREVYSLYSSSKMRIEYFLANNNAKGTARIYTLASAAQYLFTIVTATEKSEQKAVAGLLKKINPAGSDEEKIRQLENYLKTNILVNDNYPTEDLTVIIAKKHTSILGIVRLYAATLGVLGINFQIVLTTDRSDMKFDPDLDAWNHLRSYILYFPDFDKYIAPQEQFTRYGIIKEYWAANYGLFIKGVKLGSTVSGVGKVNYIEPLPCDKNFDDMNIEVKFSNDDRQEVKIVRKMGGYSALDVQPYYSLLSKEKQKEVSEELIKSLLPDAEFVSMEVKNGEITANPLEDPFTMTVNAKSSALIEKAGNKMLFKIGDIIGPQVEMYQDKERTLDVENDFNRRYDRVIKFTVPENYVIKNPNDLKMDVHHDMNGERVFTFESNYEVAGDVVTVKVTEYYKSITCPKSDFQSFRNVINAAADFNKIVLVLERK